MAEEAALTIDGGDEQGSITSEASGNDIPNTIQQPVEPTIQPPINEVVSAATAPAENGSGLFADADTPANDIPSKPTIDARSPSSPGAKMRAAQSSNAVDLGSIRNIKVKVEAILGGISMPVSQLAQIKHGEIIHLERKIGEEIEVTANGQVIGRGEIVIIEEDAPKFGISLTEII